MEENNRNKSDKKIIIAIIVLVLVVFLARFGIFAGAIALDIIANNENEKFEEVEEGINIADGKLNIENVTSTYDEETKMYIVTGYLINNADKDYSVSLTYKFKDESGNLLGTSYSDVSYLQPGETWKFKSVYSDIDAADITEYELAHVDFYNY